MPLTSKEHDPVLVTGAAGFIGSAIVAELVQRRYAVVAVVRSTESERIELLQPAIKRSRPGQLRILVGDLLSETDRHAIVDEAHARACILTAWDVRDPDYQSSPANAAWADATISLAQHAMANECKHLVGIGTCLEPYAGDRNATAYAKAKQRLATTLLDACAADESTRAIWLRVYQPFGRGEHPGRLIPQVIQALNRHEPFLLQRPQAIRDFIDVRDVAHGICDALASDATGTFDLGTGRGVTLRSVARMIAEILERPTELICEAAGTSTTDGPRTIANVGPLDRAIGWRARHTLGDALRELISETCPDTDHGLSSLRA